MSYIPLTFKRLNCKSHLSYFNLTGLMRCFINGFLADSPGQCPPPGSHLRTRSHAQTKRAPAARLSRNVCLSVQNWHTISCREIDFDIWIFHDPYSCLMLHGSMLASRNLLRTFLSGLPGFETSSSSTPARCSSRFASISSISPLP